MTSVQAGRDRYEQRKAGFTANPTPTEVVDTASPTTGTCMGNPTTQVPPLPNPQQGQASAHRPTPASLSSSGLNFKVRSHR